MSRLFFILLAPVFFSACLKTSIRNQALSDDIFRLAALRKNQLQVTLDTSGIEEYIGNQFMLLFVPFGQLKFEHSNNYIWRELYKSLTLAGFRPLAEDLSPRKSQAALKVVVQEFSTNAYDLLFIRRLKSTMLITAVYTRPGFKPLKWSDNYSTSSWKTKAFRSEVQKSIDKTLIKAFDSLTQFLNNITHDR